MKNVILKEEKAVSKLFILKLRAMKMSHVLIRTVKERLFTNTNEFMITLPSNSITSNRLSFSAIVVLFLFNGTVILLNKNVNK